MLSFLPLVVVPLAPSFAFVAVSPITSVADGAMVILGVK